MYQTINKGRQIRFFSVTILRHRVLRYLAWDCVAVLAIGQDAWFAYMKNTSFYWSESLLYKLYWFLFIPQTVLVAFLAGRFPVQARYFHNFWIHFFLALLASLFQVLIFSGLVAGLSRPSLGYAFRFEGVLQKSLSEDWFIGILMYGLLFLVFNRFSERADHPVDALPAQKASSKYLSALLIKDGARTTRIQTKTLDWIGSEDSYTVLHAAEGKWLYSESLTKLAEQLNPEDFVRIHRSCIVNIHRVQKVTSRLTGDYDVLMRDGTTLRLSRHYVRKAKGLIL